MSQNIREVLHSLRRKRLESEAEIVVATFQTVTDHYFGISKNDELIILFTTADVCSEDFKVAEFPRYEHIHVQIDQSLVVENEYFESVDRVFHLLRFKSEDEFIQTYFLQYMEGVVAKMGNSISFQDLVPVLKSSLSLFRLVSKPPRIEIQGLWAELLMIRIAVNPAEMVDAWHVSNSALWDFHSSDRIIEVKSTIGSSRLHTFKNEQLLPPKAGKESVVASLMLTRTDDGANIWDLVRAINRKIDAKHSEKVRKLVFELLGNGISHSEIIKFDFDEAVENLRFYSMNSIPCFEQNYVPVEISDVRFKVQFAGLQALNGFSV